MTVSRKLLINEKIYIQDQIEEGLKPRLPSVFGGHYWKLLPEIVVLIEYIIYLNYFTQ